MDQKLAQKRMDLQKVYSFDFGKNKYEKKGVFFPTY